MGDVAGAEDLTQGEQLVLRLHQHGKVMIRPALALAVIVAVAVIVVLLLPSGDSHAAAARAAVGAAALLAVLVWFVGPLLRWRTTTYELTTRRLRMRQGIVSRRGRDFPLSRISDVSFSQGVLDRMLGCGRLIVESPGEQGELVLNEIPHVQKVQEIMFGLVGEESARITRAYPSSDI
jgi:uncharacterized membrane protein YdbT with pleckstrin-like domain